MSKPLEQDPKMMDLGSDVYGEVSLYNGKTFVSIRRWFQADDGNWYRTKNGLHLRYDDMIEVLAHIEPFIAFVLKRAREVEGPVSDDFRGR